MRNHETLSAIVVGFSLAAPVAAQFALVADGRSAHSRAQYGSSVFERTRVPSTPFGLMGSAFTQAFLGTGDVQSTGSVDVPGIFTPTRIQNAGLSRVRIVPSTSSDNSGSGSSIFQITFDLAAPQTVHLDGRIRSTSANSTARAVLELAGTGPVFERAVTNGAIAEFEELVRLSPGRYTLSVRAMSSVERVSVFTFTEASYQADLYIPAPSAALTIGLGMLSIRRRREQ